MKKLFLLLFIIGCTASTQFLTYNNNGKKWNIDIKHTRLTQNFKLIINDQVVIDQNANFLSGNLEAKGKYDDKEVKMIVSYNRGFFGNEENYDVMIFVENELIGKFKL